MRSRVRLLGSALALVLCAGCDGPMLAPVKGRVVFRGKPVKEAAVTFNPVPAEEGATDAGKPATGFTDADGTFVLSTFRPYDGALIGRHRVLVVLDDTNPAKAKRETRITWDVKPGDN